MCCGSRRSAMRVASARTGTPRSPGAPDRPSGLSPSRGPAVGAFGSVVLEYLETAAIRVWGPVTKRRYDVSGAAPTVAMDPRDAAVLARSGVFRRA
jgi:hypothetical protein